MAECRLASPVCSSQHHIFLLSKRPEFEWPSLETRRDRSSLLLFHKIQSGAVAVEKDKYLTPAHSLKSTRSSQ